MGAIKLSLLAAASIYLSSSEAQSNSTSNSTCTGLDTFKDGYNATGSLATPGFRVNDTYPASTWTWSQYIVNAPTSDSQNTIWRTIGLKTDPILNLSDASLPYTGCAIVPTGIKMTSETEKDDGTCSTVFSSDCLKEIQDVLKNNAASDHSETQYPCASLLGSVGQAKGSKCKGIWGGWDAVQFLPRNFTQVTNKCNINPGNSDSKSRAFFSWSVGPSTDIDNFTAYDEAIRFPLPLFTAVWLKDTSNGTNSHVYSSPSWSDTRILCLPGNTTVAGSRNITVADAAANDAGRTGVSLLGVVGLAGLVALCL